MIQSVPAASPRGPALRMRCLACHAALGGGDDITRITGRLEVPAAPVDTGWHAMVDGEVVGPLGRDALVRMHRRGVLDAEALVWHAGFRGWARLADTTTFAGVLGGRRRAPRATPLGVAVLDLTDHVDLDEPAPRRASPPPLPRRLARAS